MNLLPRIGLHAFSTSLVSLHGMIMMQIMPLLALRQFAALEWGSLLITAALPAFMVASIFWDRLFRRVSVPTYVAWHWLMTGLPLALVAFAEDYWTLLALHVTAAAGSAGWSPLAGALLQRLYRDTIRGRIFGLVHCTNLIIGMGIVWAVGFWLARDADAFRLALPGVAALQLGGLALVAHLARRGEAPARDRARGTLLAPLAHAWSILKQDKLFGRYEAAFMTYGCGFMICEALLPLLLVNRLGMSYDDSAVYAFSVQRAAAALFVLPAGWLMDKAGPARTCAVSFILLAAYPLLLATSSGPWGIAAASAFFGLAMAGVAQGWMLGPVTLAPDASRVSSYVAIHTALVGLRGVVAQSLGILLFRRMGYEVPLLLATGFFIWAAWQMWGLRGQLAERMQRTERS